MQEYSVNQNSDGSMCIQLEQSWSPVGEIDVLTNVNLQRISRRLYTQRLFQENILPRPRLSSARERKLYYILQLHLVPAYVVWIKTWQIQHSPHTEWKEKRSTEKGTLCRRCCWDWHRNVTRERGCFSLYVTAGVHHKAHPPAISEMRLWKSCPAVSGHYS